MSLMDDGGFDMRILSDGSDSGDHSARIVLHLGSYEQGTLWGITLTKTDVQRLRRECGRILKELDGKGKQ